MENVLGTWLTCTHLQVKEKEGTRRPAEQARSWVSILLFPCLIRISDQSPSSLVFYSQICVQFTSVSTDSFFTQATIITWASQVLLFPCNQLSALQSERGLFDKHKYNEVTPFLNTL